MIDDILNILNPVLKFILEKWSIIIILLIIFIMIILSYTTMSFKEDPNVDFFKPIDLSKNYTEWSGSDNVNNNDTVLINDSDYIQNDTII